MTGSLAATGGGDRGCHDELLEVHRSLYDYMLALGGPLRDGDHLKYMKQAKKKLKKLKAANELFQEIQPEISSHTNFQMAAVSLNIAVEQIGNLIDRYFSQR